MDNLLPTTQFDNRQDSPNQHHKPNKFLQALLLIGAVFGLFFIQKASSFTSDSKNTMQSTHVRSYASGGIMDFLGRFNPNLWQQKTVVTKLLRPTTTSDFYGRTIDVLKLFGQKRLGDASLGTVTANRIFHASGVVVDKSVRPNHTYVVDTGNNRILGFASLGKCTGTNTACTNDTDCANGITCQIDKAKNADLIIGQADPSGSACNGDNNVGSLENPGALATYRKLNNQSLCLLPLPRATNLGEYWMRSNIDVDAQGNLYVPDVQNNRVLIFNQPFSNDKTSGRGDNTADTVLGQGNLQSGQLISDFTSNKVNHGLGLNVRDDYALNLSRQTYDHVSSRGVSVDPRGNVWVADTFNYRILRFPKLADGSIALRADLVIGQKSMTDGANNCQDPLANKSGDLTKLCTPTLARIKADTGELYVLDEYPGGFKARILVFKPDPASGFTSGMSADRTIIPNQPAPIENFDNPYVFRATGFVFNTYKSDECTDSTCSHRYRDGVLWVNEHDSFRTLLLDANNNIINVIGATSPTIRGCNTNVCSPNGAYADFNLCWPGGSIGIDNANNLYFADERYHRVSHYGLPYKAEASCVPNPNGGILAGTKANAVGNAAWAGSVGAFTYGNQLVVKDEGRYLFWNSYMDKALGADANGIISLPNRLGTRSLHTIDEQGKLWTIDAAGKIIVFQLPLTTSSQPLAENTKLYWSDDSNFEITNYGSYEGGLAFDSVTKTLWLLDKANFRILRVSNYQSVGQAGVKLLVDAVIGQNTKSGSACNQGRSQSSPMADSLCDVAQIRFDRLGNLFVVDNAYECHPNDRIMVFAKEDLASINTLFPRLEAKKVFVAPSLTQAGGCQVSTKLDEPHSPVSLAFNSCNEMVVGNDGYYGVEDDRQNKQLWFYHDPLRKNADGSYLAGQKPDAWIDLPMGAPGEMQFDANNNLIVQDHTWNKLWIINLDHQPDRDAWLRFTNNSNPTQICQNTSLTATPVVTATISPTNAVTHTPTPSLTPRPTVTLIPSATPNPTSTPSPTATTTPSISPNPTITSSPTVVTLNLKLQGVKPQAINQTVSIVFKQDNQIKYTFANAPLKTDTAKPTVAITGVAPGTYDIYVKGPTHLTKKFSGQVIAGGASTLDLVQSLLLTGDVNGDNKIDALDLSQIIANYFPSSVTAAATDLNRDNTVNAIDLGFVIENYSLEGDK